MLHVEADQAITRKMTTNVFPEPYALFHENDLGAFLLFCIECYMSEAYQTIPPILIRRLPVLIRMLLCKNLFHKALHCNSNNNASEIVNIIFYYSSAFKNTHRSLRSYKRIQMRRIFLGNIDFSNTDSTTSRIDTDVVMQESFS